MFGSLFGGSTPTLKPMTREHINAALGIIEETDEDDAEEAAESLMARGTDGMYVLMQSGNVVGITGAVPVEGSDDAVWLSWTYLTESLRGQGHGRGMMDSLLKTLNTHGIRKMFIATSDYKEDGEDIYAAAHRFYEALGAVEEMRIADYHAPGETKIVYGLENPGVEVPAPPESDAPGGLQIDGLGPAPESEGGFALHWNEGENGVTGLEKAMAEARGARMVVAALPEDLSAIAATALTEAGFTKQGTLRDHYAAGTGQDWWVATP